MSPVAASGGMSHAAVWKKAKALGMFGNLGRAVYEENLLHILCTYVQPRYSWCESKQMRAVLNLQDTNC